MFIYYFSISESFSDFKNILVSQHNLRFYKVLLCLTNFQYFYLMTNICFMINVV